MPKRSDKPAVPDLIPDRPTLPAVRNASKDCQACDLYRHVVKHFKWEPRGKRRIHKKPGASEIAACRPWLDTEIQLVKPRAIVCLGATAAQALLGKQFKVTAHRGTFISSSLAPVVTATVHPSSILRERDDEARRREQERFVDDLRKGARALSS